MKEIVKLVVFKVVITHNPYVFGHVVEAVAQATKIVTGISFSQGIGCEIISDNIIKVLATTVVNAEENKDEFK